MKTVYRHLIAILCATLMVGCGGGSGGSGNTSASIEGTYSATVTGIDIVRIDDKHSVNTTSFPAQGAVITVSP